MHLPQLFFRLHIRWYQNLIFSCYFILPCYTFHSVFFQSFVSQTIRDFRGGLFFRLTRCTKSCWGIFVLSYFSSTCFLLMTLPGTTLDSVCALFHHGELVSENCSLLNEKSFCLIFVSLLTPSTSHCVERIKDYCVAKDLKRNRFR